MKIIDKNWDMNVINNLTSLKKSLKLMKEITRFIVNNIFIAKRLHKSYDSKITFYLNLREKKVIFT